MAPIPKDEPVDREDDSGSDHFDGGDIAYANDLSGGSDDDEVDGELEHHGGYTMLSQESYGTTSEMEHELTTTTTSEPAALLDSNRIDRMIRSLDAQDQMQFASYPASSDPTGVEELSTSPSVWAPTVVREVHTSPEQAATIMAAMKNFSLPAHNFPAWATTVPEDVWKEQLFARIRRGPSEVSAVLDPAPETVKEAVSSKSSTS